MYIFVKFLDNNPERRSNSLTTACFCKHCCIQYFESASYLIMKNINKQLKPDNHNILFIGKMFSMNKSDYFTIAPYFIRPANHNTPGVHTLGKNHLYCERSSLRIKCKRTPTLLP